MIYLIVLKTFTFVEICIMIKKSGKRHTGYDIMNIEDYNREAWKHEVENKEMHTIPISREDFQKA